MSAKLMNMFEERHSGRSYDSSKKVSKDQLEKLIKAAHLAPSCYNEQPWRFLIAEKTEDADSYNKILSALAEGNQAWAKNAPVLLVVCSCMKFAKNGKPNRWGPYDSGAAGFSMALEASTMGLMAHQMGGFDEGKIQKDFAIPEDYIPMAAMAIGYEAAPENKVIPPKDRKPMGEQFFKGIWGNSFPL